MLDAFYDAWGDGAGHIWQAINMDGFNEDLARGKNKITSNIQLGMTEKQVTDTLGKPYLVVTHRPGIRSLMWPIGNVEIQDGKVVEKFP